MRSIKKFLILSSFSVFSLIGHANANDSTAKAVFLKFTKAAAANDLEQFKSFYSQKMMKSVIMSADQENGFFKLFMVLLPHDPIITSEGYIGEKYVIKGYGKATSGETSGFTELIKEGGVWKVYGSKWEPKDLKRDPPLAVSQRIKISNTPTIRVENPSIGTLSKTSILYLSNSNMGPATALIRVTPGKPWTLVESSNRPGLFDKAVAQGNFGTDGTMTGLPGKTMVDKWIWRAGDIRVFVNGTELK